jgi:hypothetical protein
MNNPLRSYSAFARRRLGALACAIALASVAGCGGDVVPSGNAPQLGVANGGSTGVTGSTQPTPAPPSTPPVVPAAPPPASAPPPAVANSALSAVWANDGSDKVTRDELRSSTGKDVRNSLWNGTTIDLLGARNEVINFNLVLEAAKTGVDEVSVSISDLIGPGGSALRYAPRTAATMYDWSSTEIELFYVRYLQIKGFSYFGFGPLEGWGDAALPQRARCPGMKQPDPHKQPTGTDCSFAQRPIANRYVPDIAVPLEMKAKFSVASGANQSIWADIYIPKSASPGHYTGTVTIYEHGTATRKVPVALTVRNFALPDVPNSRTMLYASVQDLESRFGSKQAALTAYRNELRVAHRHKIAVIGNNFDTDWGAGKPDANWLPYLDGSGFSTASGYAGPGVGTGQDVFSIGTYGGVTHDTTQDVFTSRFNSWATWFENNAPNVERFVYLCDEVYCKNSKPTLSTQLSWWQAISGPGRRLQTLATLGLIDAPAALSFPTSTWDMSGGNSHNQNGTSAVDQAAIDALLAQSPARKPYYYNGARPGAGSMATEDDGVAMREVPWGQYKKRLARYFIWEGTYFDDYQQGRGKYDVFSSAETFGPDAKHMHDSHSYGLIGGSMSNGNGVLFYPGTDVLYPANSYGLPGPIVSLRLKHWRRGVQDVDYLTLAHAIDPAAVDAIVQKIVPRVLWEVQCYTPKADCSYTYEPASWSSNPDDWEAARAQLAHIIDGQ